MSFFFKLGVVFGGINVSLGPRQKDLMYLGEVQQSVFVASTIFLWSSSVTSSALVPVSCFVGKPVSWGRWYFFFGGQGKEFVNLKRAAFY